MKNRITNASGNAMQMVENITDPNSQPRLKKNIVKMEIDEIRESRRIRKWKEGFVEETETSRGWLSRRLFLPLGVSVSSPRAQATQKLRMMIRTPDPVSDNQDSEMCIRDRYDSCHRRRGAGGRDSGEFQPDLPIVRL